MNRELQVNLFQIDDIQLNSESTHIKDRTLYLNQEKTGHLVDRYPELTDIQLQVLHKNNWEQVHVNTIMDVIPIKTKMKNNSPLGEGVTTELSGVVVMMTAREASGKQFAEFGSTAGKLSEKVAFNRPGCPDEHDLILHVDMTIVDGISMTRDGPIACHRAVDELIQEIRNVIKDLVDHTTPADGYRIREGAHDNEPTVLLVKEMMGQGGMHDNILLPIEPCGVTGGKSVVDLGNMPVLLSPNEALDGSIHAMTCVGPSTKETTRHYARDPLVQSLYLDQDLYLKGVIAVGSPQSNHEKDYVADRVGMIVEQVNPDGVIVMTEGFGNNHIDFARHIEEVGKRNIPVVGVTYAAKQGALITGNPHMDALVELNKNESMVETEVLAENTLMPEDADRAIHMLKDKLYNNGVNIHSEIPVPKKPSPVWAEPPRDLSSTKVALVTAAGVHLKDQEPFEVAGDNTYREIPWDVDSQNLMVTHGGYDHKDVRQDINCMFPIDRLNQLASEGVIHGGSAVHIGFMGGGGDFQAFNDSVGPEIAEKLKKAQAGACILTAG